MKRRIKLLVVTIWSWAFLGCLHYFAAAFSELTLDFMSWDPVTRFVFAVMGFLALVIMLLFFRFELWYEPKTTAKNEEE